MRIDREFETEEVRPRTRFTARELLDADFPEPRFAVPGLVAEGLTFFVGAPKLGKSWLGLSLSIAVAAGGRALGAIPVDQGEVLYLALEDPPRRLKARLQMVLGAEAPPDQLHFETEWPRLGEGGEEALDLWLFEHPGCRLVICDVYARIRPRVSERAERYGADYAAVQPLKTLADRFNVAVIAVHHTRKASADDFLESVSGTNGIAGAADSILVMKRSRGQADAELHVTGRDVEERELALRFSSEVGTWSLLGDADEWSLSEARRKVQNALREFGPLSPSQLAERLNIAYENAKKTLQRMANDEQIAANGDGIYSSLHGNMSLLSPQSPISNHQGTAGTKGTPLDQEAG